MYRLGVLIIAQLYLTFVKRAEVQRLFHDPGRAGGNGEHDLVFHSQPLAQALVILTGKDSPDLYIHS